MTRSTFYYNRREKSDKWSVERAEVASIFHENCGRYGYRRITSEMRNRGYTNNHKTVQKLMKESELKCLVRIKKYRSYKGEIGKIAPNLIFRDFYADRPLQKLATDVTEFSLFGVKRYLSPVFDMFNGEIIHYTLYERPVLDMILEMTKGTIKKSARIQVLYCIPIRGGHISIKHINSCLRVMGYDKACREKVTAWITL